MGLMPKPRFILSTSLACDANTLTFRHLAQFYDVPHFNVDIPFESSPQAVDYVAGQLRQMGEFLTQQTGLPWTTASWPAPWPAVSGPWPCTTGASASGRGGRCSAT